MGMITKLLHAIDLGGDGRNGGWVVYGWVGGSWVDGWFMGGWVVHGWMGGSWVDGRFMGGWVVHEWMSVGQSWWVKDLLVLDALVFNCWCWV